MAGEAVDRRARKFARSRLVDWSNWIARHRIRRYRRWLIFFASHVISMWARIYVGDADVADTVVCDMLADRTTKSESMGFISARFSADRLRGRWRRRDVVAAKPQSEAIYRNLWQPFPA
jgi:hypothetical protein